MGASAIRAATPPKKRTIEKNEISEWGSMCSIFHAVD